MTAEAPDGLPPLRDVIARYKLAARKSLGQNFLLDLNLTGRIARVAGALDGVQVVEIGPGPGGLTRALLSQGARHVVAVERDRRCLEALAEIAAQFPGRLSVLEGDALKVDALAALDPGPARIVANLPYNIGTELFTRWMSAPDWPPRWDSLTLMFQREVAERIVARPGSRAYGRLSVLAQWRAAPRIAFDVNPSAFSPPPKVVSSVLHLVPTEPRREVNPALLARLTAAAFGQRRKMLRQSLKAALPDPLGPLARAGIDPTLRAEALSVDDYLRLAEEVAAD